MEEAVPGSTTAPRGRGLCRDFLARGYQWEVLAILLLGLAGFYVTALLSFNPLDPSPVAAAFPERTVTNLAGPWGAGLVGAVIYALGIFATAPAILTISLAWRLLRRGRPSIGPHWLMAWFLVIVAGAALTSMKHPELEFRGYEFPSGGILGSITSEWLLRHVGPWGTVLWIATALLSAPALLLRREVMIPTATSFWRWLSQWRPRFRQGPTAVQPGGAAMPTEARNFASPTVGFNPSDQPLVLQPPLASPEPDRTAPQESWESSVTPPAFGHRPLRAPYVPPSLVLLKRVDGQGGASANPRELEQTAALLTRTFEDFGVTGQVVGTQPGPVVTVFEYEPDAGIKQAKVVGLIDDLALALKVDSIFIHPVRGKKALGVQVPNSRRDSVYLGDVLNAAAFRESPSPLTFGMGKTINGQPMCADLTTMPHLLVAGATGAGKSVCINSLLCSVIMKAPPADVRMILVDPKMLELSVYEGIPHLLMPVITEPAKASLALQWAVVEMERRYKLMQMASVRNIAAFNDQLEKMGAARRSEMAAAMGEETPTEKLPYILLVIDELADLMMTAPKDVEGSIQRLAQKARASGIHMVLATQRPSVDIITGVIKANLPCRIAFQVVSKHDSRTILDLIGAEKLLGKGDMLLQRPGIGRLERLQGALVTDEEVLSLVAAAKGLGPVQYDDAIISWIDTEFARRKDSDSQSDEGDCAPGDDPRWGEAVQIGRGHGAVSASFLQRQLKIGYNRAARMVEHMEARGLVAKADGAKPRKWLGGVATT